jgi:hypothetical protein
MVVETRRGKAPGDIIKLPPVLPAEMGIDTHRNRRPRMRAQKEKVLVVQEKEIRDMKAGPNIDGPTQVIPKTTVHLPRHRIPTQMDTGSC